MVETKRRQTGERVHLEGPGDPLTGRLPTLQVPCSMSSGTHGDGGSEASEGEGSKPRETLCSESSKQLESCLSICGLFCALLDLGEGLREPLLL